MTWGVTSVAFTSSSLPGSWLYGGLDVPQPGGENARMNLWLFRGMPPSNGQPIEVVVRGLTFTPAP